MRRRRAAIATAFALAVAGAGLPSFGIPAVAAGDGPRIAIVRNDWKSANGRCEADLQHAVVVGVSPHVAAVIDETLLRMERGVTDATPAAREITCARRIRAVADIRPDASFFDAGDWTRGLMTERWLSLRFHETHGSTVQAHPSDAYRSVTFDLAHGGYPVPTSGFYRPADRARFDAALYAADLADMRALARTEPGLDVYAARLRARDASLTITADRILLTAAGVELSGIAESEAERNRMFTIAYAALDAIGTPNGPLDPATRPAKTAQSRAGE